MLAAALTPVTVGATAASADTPPARLPVHFTGTVLVSNGIFQASVTFDDVAYRTMYVSNGYYPDYFDNDASTITLSGVTLDSSLNQQGLEGCTASTEAVLKTGDSAPAARFSSTGQANFTVSVGYDIYGDWTCSGPDVVHEWLGQGDSMIACVTNNIADDPTVIFASQAGNATCTGTLTSDASPDPKAEFTALAAGTHASFDASASTPSDGIVSYLWDFGDDTDPVEVTTGPTTTHDYAKAGLYHVTLTVKDSQGRTATITHDVDARPTGLVVNSTGDGDDADTSDGACDTGGKVGDAPECTLRAAIEEANARSGADTITFDISGGGTPRITPSTLLPNITDSATIDGTSQSGNWVELDATGLQNGLHLTGGTSTVRGLAIWGALSAAVSIGGGSGHRIVGDHIGTDATGTADDRAAHYGVGVTGAPGVVIGGTGNDGNVIVGGAVVDNLAGSSVFIGSGSAGAQIVGNVINEKQGGTAPAGPGEGVGTGVRVQSPQAVVKNNEFGSGSRAVWLNADAKGAMVQGNTIGVSVGGSVPMPVTDGIRVEGTPNVTVQDNTVIATHIDVAVAGRQTYTVGNDGGTSLRNPSVTDSTGPVTGTGAVISGNTLGYQGTDDGPAGLRTAGVYLWDGATGVMVTDNTIAGHKDTDVMISGGSGDTLAGNRIDVLKDGKSKPGTVASDSGISAAGAVDLTIGLVDQPNVIGFAKRGIYLYSQDADHPSTNVKIQSNDIGVGLDGSTDMGMKAGVVLGAAVATTIGGGNQILDNETGIEIGDTSVKGTVITGNKIGRSVLDTSKESVGIYIGAVPDVRIGPGNTIGGVNGPAIETLAVKASIGENAIGMTALNGLAWANNGPGISVEAGHADILSDEIAHNTQGVVSTGAGTAYVRNSSIHDNSEAGIVPAHAPDSPTGLAVVKAPATGTPRSWVALTGLVPNAPVIVEVFANSSCIEGTQGETPLMQKATAVSAAGGVVVTLLGDDFVTDDHFTVTVSDPAGGGATSKFSTCVDRDADPVDTDGDGIPDAVEKALSPGWENNATQAVVPGDGDRDFTQLVATEGKLANVAPADVTGTVPSGLSFPGGLVSFEITGLTVGDSAQVLMQSPATATQYWRYGPPTLGAAPSWYEWNYDATRGTGAKLKSPGVWILYLRDGAAGDDDGAMNGVIKDPGGPAVYAPPAAGPGGSAGAAATGEDAAGGAASGGASGAPDPTAPTGSAGAGAASTGSITAPTSDVSGPSSIAVLASTGTRTLPLALLAALLLVTGAALLAAGRRPRRRTS